MFLFLLVFSNLLSCHFFVLEYSSFFPPINLIFVRTYVRLTSIFYIFLCVLSILFSNIFSLFHCSLKALKRQDFPSFLLLSYFISFVIFSSCTRFFFCSLLFVFLIFQFGHHIIFLVYQYLRQIGPLE